jgi:hypothetical protein
MSAELVAETIERWAELRREYESAAYPQGEERMRNWLFGAGLALQLLDDPALLEIALRALEASENGINRNRTVGADAGDNLGISSVDNQREHLADGEAGR